MNIRIIAYVFSMLAIFQMMGGCSEQSKPTAPPTAAPQNNGSQSTNNGTGETLDRQTVAPGEFVRQANQTLSFWWPADNDADCSPYPCEPAPVTLCELAGPSTTTVAFIEIAGPFEWIFLETDCSGPYQTDVFRIPVRVFAVAAGQELPTEMHVLFRQPATIPEQIVVG